MTKHRGFAGLPHGKLSSQRKDGQLRTNALEADARFAVFAEEYVALHGNACRAAIAAGYPQAYAKHNAWELAARLKLRTQPVLRRDGLDEVFVARKLKRLCNAKMPK